MGISQPQNLRTPPIEKLRPYGDPREPSAGGDPFRKLLGPEWQRLHWYSDARGAGCGHRGDEPAARVLALRRQYSRSGDSPALVFQKIEKLAESRGL